MVDGDYYCRKWKVDYMDWSCDALNIIGGVHHTFTSKLCFHLQVLELVNTHIVGHKHANIGQKKYLDNAKK
jgi:hypothetical protein